MEAPDEIESFTSRMQKPKKVAHACGRGRLGRVRTGIGYRFIALRHLFEN